MCDDAWDACADATPFREQLRIFETQAGKLVSAGSISSVSKNSASQTYGFGNGMLTAAEIARGWRQLIDLFDQTSTNLGPVSELEIKTEMLLSLANGCREFTKDFTCLR
jgi:hypothetical protein